MSESQKPRRSMGRTVAVGVGEITGLRPLSKAIGGTIHEHRVMAGFVGGLLRQAFSREQAPDIAPGISDASARFLAALRYYGVDRVRLAALERRTWNLFALHFLLFAVSIVAGTFLFPAVRVAQGGSLFWAVLVAYAFVPLTGANAIKKAFQHWQLRTRSTGRFQTWLTSPDQWWPPSPEALAAARATRALIWLAVIGGGGFLLFSGHADAQTATAGLDTAYRTDLPGKVLSALAASGGNPFTQNLGLFASRLSAIAAAMLAWHTVSGLVATAHSGKVLGERWHPTWAPIRVCLGMAMLVPASTSGLTGGQGLVLELAAAGSNFASDQWATFVQNTLIPAQQTAANGSTTTTTGGTGLGVPAPIGGMEVVRQVLRSELCQQSYAAEPTLQRSGLSGFLFGQPAIPPQPDPAGAAVQTPTGGFQLWNYGVCGSVTVPLTASVATGALSSSSQTDAPTQAFVKARIAAVGAVITSIRNTKVAVHMAQSQQPGSGYTQGWPQGIVSQFSAAGGLYDSTMTQAAGTYLSAENSASYQQIVNDAKSNGWPAMGAFWRTLAQASDAVTDLAAEPPTFNGPRVNGLFGAHFDDAAKDADRNLGILDKQWTMEAASPQLSGADLAGPGDNNSDILSRILGPLSKSLVQGFIDLGTTNTTDPMRTMTNFGNLLIGAVEAGIGIGAVVAAASGNGITAMFGALAAFLWAQPWALLILGSTLTLGIAHAIVLPLLPFISVLWLFVGWVVFVGEALIAAPIYWLMWCRMDGLELVDSYQKPGIILLFNLLLRPVLGVLAFEFVYYALPICMGALNAWFAPAFVGVQGGHFTGLFMALAGFAMLTYLEYQVTVRVCAAIHEIPDTVLRWYGASAEQRGEGAQTDKSRTMIVGGTSSGLDKVRHAGKQPKDNKPKGGNIPTEDGTEGQGA